MTPIIVSVTSGVLLAIMTGLMAFFKKQAKAYKTLLDEQKEQNIRNTIREEIEPIIEEIHRLWDRIEQCETDENEHIGTILASYKFRLIYLCKTYLRQAYMTQDQYDQLSEFFKVYHELGGNGQAQEYYERAMALPIQNK